MSAVTWFKCMSGTPDRVRAASNAGLSGFVLVDLSLSLSRKKGQLVLTIYYMIINKLFHLLSWNITDVGRKNKSYLVKIANICLVEEI